jgi:hypothetical protein
MSVKTTKMTVAVMIEGDAVARERNCSGRLIQAVHMRAAYPGSREGAKTRRRTLRLTFVCLRGFA